MVTVDHLAPTWNIDDFKILNYKKASYRGSELIKQYLNAGHTYDSLELFNYFEPNPMPEAVYEQIVPHFSFLDNISVAVNLFKPGQFIPVHSDRYDRYAEIHNLTSVDNVVRYVVMLEDGLPGQIMEINQVLVSYWKAGDCFGWPNTVPHAFYNFSTANRYAMQITGILNG
jgi:hypothetical protein